MPTIWEIIAEAQARYSSGTEDFDNAKLLQKQADRENAEEGNLKGIDCRKCKNRGHISVVKNDELVWQMCSCMRARKSLERIEKSGLKTAIEELRFDNFITTEKWQENMLTLAKDYVENGEKKWLFLGGNSGSGKSHLCTAVCGELLKREKAVRYMMWRDESAKLKAVVNDSAEYSRLIGELKEIEVLYIDDFLKVQRGQQPTPADINLAFEILNYRYSNKLQTIISSEKTLDDILSLDDAVGGRIYELAKGFGMSIAYDKNKNFRLRK